MSKKKSLLDIQFDFGDEEMITKGIQTREFGYYVMKNDIVKDNLTPDQMNRLDGHIHAINELLGAALVGQMNKLLETKK